MSLVSNKYLASRGVMPGSEGFQIEQANLDRIEADLLKPYVNGRDIL